MIRRVVRLKLNEGVGADEVLTKTYDVLPKVKGVQSCRVGVPEHAEHADYDVVFFVDFQRIEDVAAYVDDPVHRDYVDNFLNPRVALKDVVNIRIW